MQTIDNYNFKNKRALIRVDFNVPLNDKFEITDDTRMRAAVPTIKKVLAGGGSVILMSHLGRPKNGPEDKFSLKHILKHLEELLGVPVKFADDCIGESAKEQAAALNPGEVLLLENLRFYKEEEKGDEGFAQKLASLGDVWINDAFGTAHRAHASTAVIAKFFPNDKLFGYVMKGELESVDRVMHNPVRPFTAIMGGSKVSSKIDIIMNLMDKVDNLILGGGMTYTFKKALGGHIGTSICEDDKLDLALEIMKIAKEKGVNLVLATDTVAGDAFSNDANTQLVSSMEIPDGWEGLDIGPETIATFSKIIEESKTILWNGPVGVFEMPKFAVGTKAIADAIVKATAKGAFTLIGGGDSVAAINQFGLADKVSYVSTGGGALLEYIEGKELPGITAIRGK
ncbi:MULTISPECIES: phosphoglycerate kinase [Butyricimonas]|uniref:phosphoglycerate kinase n=1 Tax=Butyricimonas TaxID=574697 RepID=UPI001D08EECA|nr:MULTISPECIES: phosphoglycerate kinase [Butyricimonas]MCB6972218.1 phosphoglycerate kinase [Butyricimonas synergistica]MCG4519219.1 phosphoglycerate kinase [Butyricimonas sp. DFI.6.44]